MFVFEKKLYDLCKVMVDRKHGNIKKRIFVTVPAALAAVVIVILLFMQKCSSEPEPLPKDVGVEETLNQVQDDVEVVQDDEVDDVADDVDEGIEEEVADAIEEDMAEVGDDMDVEDDVDDAIEEDVKEEVVKKQEAEEEILNQVQDDVEGGQDDAGHVQEPVLEPAGPTLQPDATPQPVSAKPKARPMVALKTNLLFDLMATPNVELEVPFAKDRFSLMGEYWFPWWRTRDNANCYQFLYGGLEGRWWFQDRAGREALTGHFVGLYGGAGLYDFEHDSRGYQGELFSAGVSYGYSFRLNRSLRIETSLGLGYMQTAYSHYIGMEDGRYLVWINDGIYRYLGPTKLKVSLVWVLQGKGGRK